MLTSVSTGNCAFHLDPFNKCFFTSGVTTKKHFACSHACFGVKGISVGLKSSLSFRVGSSVCLRRGCSTSKFLHACVKLNDDGIFKFFGRIHLACTCKRKGRSGNANGSLAKCCRHSRYFRVNTTPKLTTFISSFTSMRISMNMVKFDCG